jgi:putative methyltransferase (TIGR04325 family)
MKSLIRRALVKLFGLKLASAPSKYGYAGSFQSWTEAKSEFHGYQDPQIADRVASGARAVLEGAAAYERDSITFSSRQYSFPVAAALMWAGLKNHGNLKVLDFGGGLGTSIVQNQPFLGTLNNVSWTIIEQPTFVAQGKELFDGAALVFGDDIGVNLKRFKPDLVLLSSSLQYVEKPFEILQLVADAQVEMVVLDRTLFSGAADDFVTRQKVPDDIFPATIPVWIFSETKFCAFMERRYRLMSKFASSQTTVDWDSDGRKLEELGFIYVLQGSAYDSLLEAPASLLERKND